MALSTADAERNAAGLLVMQHANVVPEYTCSSCKSRNLAHAKLGAKMVCEDLVVSRLSFWVTTSAFPPRHSAGELEGRFLRQASYYQVSCLYRPSFSIAAKYASASSLVVGKFSSPK